MIVISAVLVVVGAALLIAGLVSSGLVLIYVALGVTVVAALLLLLGVRDGGRLALRSGTPAAGTPVEGPTYTDLPAIPGAEATAPVGAAAPLLPTDSAGTVVVVSGRPRYHAAGCRFLTGRDEAEDISVEEARELGFTPCGACKPDDHLEGAIEPAPTDTAVLPVADETPDALEASDAPAAEAAEAAELPAPAAADGDAGVTVLPAGPDLTKPATARKATKAPAKKAVAAKKATTTRTPVKKAAPAKAAAPAAEPTPAATGGTPAVPAKKAPAKRAAKATSAPAAKAAPAKATKVAAKTAVAKAAPAKKAPAKRAVTTGAAKTTKAPAKKTAAKKTTS